MVNVTWLIFQCCLDNRAIVKTMRFFYQEFDSIFFPSPLIVFTPPVITAAHCGYPCDLIIEQIVMTKRRAGWISESTYRLFDCDDDDDDDHLVISYIRL